VRTMTTPEGPTGATQIWMTVTGACALAGGTAWLLKQVAIALSATGGEPPEPNGIIETCYIAGVALMLVGASGVAALLLRRSAPIVWMPIAVLTAPVVFFSVHLSLMAAVRALVGESAHWWWESEAGIVLTVLVFLGIGAALLAGRRRTAPQHSVPAGI
jgi:hypothetical protein